MRIEQLRLCKNGNSAKAAATVIWEDASRAPQEFYFETHGESADCVSANPHAFLVPCAVAAMRHGERRIAIDAEICPELKLGLIEALSLLRFWSGDTRPPIRIESRSERRLKPLNVRRAAFCFTGGIDSLATLRNNRLNFQPGDDGYFRDGVLIFGLEVEELGSFHCVTDVLSQFARHAGVTLIPVYTNIQELDKNWTFWTDEFEAAVLASVGHSLHERIGSLSIGSSFDYANLHPHGSHPLLDPNYSSNDLHVRHDCNALSRLEKTRMLGEWGAALHALRVCNRYETYRPGVINCGTCEKCLRTLTALMLTGKVKEASTFAQHTVTPELIAANVHMDGTSFPFWAELVVPLEQQGKHELAGAISDAIARYRGEVGLKGALKRMDRVHLNGSLHAIKATLSHASRGLRRAYSASSTMVVAASQTSLYDTVSELLLFLVT